MEIRAKVRMLEVKTKVWSKWVLKADTSELNLLLYYTLSSFHSLFFFILQCILLSLLSFPTTSFPFPPSCFLPELLSFLPPVPPTLLALTPIIFCSFSTSTLVIPSPLSLAPTFHIYLLPSFHLFCFFQKSLFLSPAPAFLSYILLLDFLYHLLNFLILPSFSSLFIPSRFHPVSLYLVSRSTTSFPSVLSNFPFSTSSFLLYLLLLSFSISSFLPHPCIIFLRPSLLLYVLFLLPTLPSSYFSSLPPLSLQFLSPLPFCFIVLAPYFLLESSSLVCKPLTFLPSFSASFFPTHHPLLS